MSLLQDFRKFIVKENLFSPTDTLLLAVSGGVDSVVLCELCQQAEFAFIIAHGNFQLRGKESERDEQFVTALGAKYGRRVLVKAFGTEEYAAAGKVSIQVAARELRYKWFTEIINDQPTIINGSSMPNKGEQLLPEPEETAISRRLKHLPVDASLPATQIPRPITRILTAHHLDDNIETMLMNFFKGTGIAGLRGIIPKQGNIVRPLLFARKEALKQFAVNNQLEWVDDSSNHSDKYARNYFRNQLIPLVKTIYPEAENNLGHNLQRFREIELLYHQSIDLHKKKLLEFKGSEIHVPVLKLLKTMPLASVVYEIIRNYGFDAGQVEETIALLKSETGRYIQSATHRIVKNRSWIIITPLNNEEVNLIVIEEPGKIAFGKDGTGGSLDLSLHQADEEKRISGSPYIASLDAAAISFPLLLRKWKNGDYFYPLGLRKKKKLARFFIDQKLSKTDKEKTWLLEADKKIIWIVGQRIDDRFKITPATQQVLRIVLKKR